METLTPAAPVKTTPSAAASGPRRDPAWTVRTLDRGELATLRARWDDLAQNALEPNCFYESWMLLPALAHFDQDVPLEFVVVERAETTGTPVLAGLFPFERKTRLRGVPVRLLSLWKHLHCFLCTPLVHRDHAREVLQALLRWAKADPRGATLLEFTFVAGDGPFAQALVDVINDIGCLTFPLESFNRALLRTGAGADASVQAALTPKHRRELQRMRRRLGDLGRVETRSLPGDGDPGPWIEQFLHLEAHGWKGTEQTALGCTDAQRAYFATIARAAHERGQLMMLGLFLDDRPIALKCNFRAGAGSFAFKIAFDEQYDKYSPGVQLELDNIAAATNEPGLAWMDSCANANHPMINRLWPARRTIQSVVLSSGKWRGDLLVGLLPMMRSIKRLFRRANPG